MKLRIPDRIVDSWERFVDWGNEPAKTFTFRGKPRELLRIDLIIVGGFIFCVSYGWLFWGWQGALQQGVLYAALSYGAWVFNKEHDR